MHASVWDSQLQGASDARGSGSQGAASPFQKANTHLLGRKPQEPVQKLSIKIRGNNKTSWVKGRTRGVRAARANRLPREMRAAESKGWAEQRTPELLHPSTPSHSSALKGLLPPSMAGGAKVGRSRHRGQRKLASVDHQPQFCLVSKRFNYLWNEPLRLPFPCPEATASPPLSPNRPFIFQRRPRSSLKGIHSFI